MKTCRSAQASGQKSNVSTPCCSTRTPCSSNEGNGHCGRGENLISSAASPQLCTCCSIKCVQLVILRTHINDPIGDCGRGPDLISSEGSPQLFSRPGIKCIELVIA